MPDLAAYARRIIDAHVYMTLATADAQGRPWASPVWFAHEDHTRFVWVSRPDAAIRGTSPRGHRRAS